MSKLIINAFADESDSSLSGQIDALRRNYLDGIEVRNVDGKNIADIPLERVKEISKELGDNGLNVWSIGSRLGKIKITDDFAPHMEEFKHTLEIAETMNAKYIRLFSFYIPKGEAPENYKDAVQERMGKFVETAAGSNVMLCHENEKGIYGDVAQRCVDIHNAFPTLGCIFDPANFIQCNQDTLEGWKLLEKYVTYMHIKDALSDGSVVPAGKGAGNLKELLAKYVSIGGKGVTVEPHLSVFKGLAGLEREGEKSVVGKVSFPSKEAAFDAAIAALREII